MLKLLSEETLHKRFMYCLVLYLKVGGGDPNLDPACPFVRKCIIYLRKIPKWHAGSRWRTQPRLKYKTVNEPVM